MMRMAVARAFQPFQGCDARDEVGLYARTGGSFRLGVVVLLASVPCR